MPDSPEKEILNQLFSEQDKYQVVQEGEPEIDKEKTPLIEKVEQEIFLTKPVADDYGQPILTSQVAPAPTIVLPISKSSYLSGLKMKVVESLRWLAEWCGRIIKIFGARTKFREVEVKNESN